LLSTGLGAGAGACAPHAARRLLAARPPVRIPILRMKLRLARRTTPVVSIDSRSSMLASGSVGDL
jgi:hypothetical protein